MVSSKITTSSTFQVADAAMMAPFASSDDQWGWTHYGFYILDLPQPFGYLNANSVIGTAGSHTWNRPAHDQKNPKDCRRDASLHVSTGGSEKSPGGWHHAVYDTSDPSQAQLAEDGSEMKWKHQGTNDSYSQTGTFEIQQAFPKFTLRAKWSDWEFDLTFTMTRVPAVVTHFARMKNRYEHFSLMANAQGWIRFRNGEQISSPPNSHWPANIEYARSITPQMLSPARLPFDKMVPDTNFTYQILTVSSPARSQSSENFQILIARTGTRKNGTVSFLWLRSATDEFKNSAFPVIMRVVRYQRVPTIGGDSETAIVPAEIEWVVRGPSASRSSDPLLKLSVYPGQGENGNLLWRGRFGAGFNTGCKWSGTYRGRSLLEDASGAQEGYGHVEWIDVEANEKDISAARADSRGGRSQL